MSEAPKRGRQSSGSDDSPAAKKSVPSSTSTEQNETVRLPVIPAKVFVTKQTFEDVTFMGDDEMFDSNWDEHFGFNWGIILEKTDTHLSVYVVEESKRISIEGELRIDLIGQNADSTEKKLSVRLPVVREAVLSKVGCEEMLEWDKLSEYTVYDNLTVQIEFKISYIAELKPSGPSKFDWSKSEVSNCILVAQDRKFYVSNHFLATHSPYFKALLLGPFKEADMPEVPLLGLDPYDVENFLRVLYGYEAVNDHTVEGLLLMADKNDTPIIKEKCEEFLVNYSEKNIGKIFDMFLKYNCNMDKIIDEIKTLDEYKDVIGGDIDRFDNELAKKLLKKGAEILLD